MKLVPRPCSILLLAFGIALAACSKQSPQPAVDAAASAADAQARKALDLYRQLQQAKSYEFAAPIGREIVEKYPNSAAAHEVQQTLAETVAKADAITTRRRLSGLWSYQTGKESGGDQSTASIYSKEVAGADKVRLILRRHSAWGQSAYLFGSGKGFECSGNCTIPVRFDEQPPKKMKAYRPDTGEPALFIADDKAFIEHLATARTISIDVVEKGHGPRTLVFEVGGFDPERFPTVKKK